MGNNLFKSNSQMRYTQDNGFNAYKGLLDAASNSNIKLIPPVGVGVKTSHSVATSTKKRSIASQNQYNLEENPKFPVMKKNLMH